ncbi:hypothetical protein QBC32DRAFT_377986 [Pseudoneurospora amorphoporcata]|uniref:Uncharacterized protein n=1 Tax=Pseudoneurospora amorphoporcata TaxID=241081 RepID=A0AAN6NPN0_9PEZI|nr:hypothetical protein QBC32DRAFT_377986 [Pseudoneurospora amorphoporcata]
MPWGINFFGRRNNQNQKKKGSSSKSPKKANKPINRVTKPRASSTGSLDKSKTSIQNAIDSSASAPPVGARFASRLFGTDPSNLTSFNLQKPPPVTLSPSELAIQKRNQRQAALAQRRAQEEHDDQLRLASIRRVDPTVTPASDAFQTILYSFRTHLDSPTSTLNELLQSRFSPDDRDLLQPADWERNPALAQLQGRNSDVYQRLVRGEVPGWRKEVAKGSKGDKKRVKADNQGWAKEADLAFKLTCLYFGLPVAPMGWEQSETKRWWEKRQQTMKVRERGGYGGPGFDEVEDDMGNVIRRPREDPIKFLNCYTKRVFEKDAIREPDPVLETYNALPKFPQTLRELDPEKDYINADALRANFPDRLDSDFGLRGGGDFDDEEEEDVVDEGEEHSMDVHEPMELIPSPENALVSLRGGGPLKDLGEVFKDIDNGKWRLTTEAFHAFAQTDNHKEGLKSRLEGERGGVENLWIPLYGYQGIVWFRIDMLNTFVDAVDRLLGFGVRAGASYRLYLFDRNKEYKTRAQKEAFQRNNRNTLDVACKGPGDYSNDHLAWNWVIGHLGSLGNDTNGSPVAHQKVLFVAGPEDPVPYEWEPTDIHNVAKLVLEWDGMPEMNRPDVAYLRMPISGDPTTADVHTNQFAPWMAQACRVLCAGRIPNRPGQPYIPDAYISYDTDSGTYGGLTFNLDQWTRILQAYKESRGGPIVLTAYTFESPSGNIDRWHMYVPGVSYEYSKDVAILHSEFKDPKLVHAKIRNMLETGLGLEQLQDLDFIEVHLPGEPFFADTKGPSNVVIPVDSNGKLDKPAVQIVAELLEQWYNWLKEKPGVKPAKNGLDMFPQFITLQPVYREYALVCDEDHEQVLEWNPRETSLDDFRDLVAELWLPGRFSVDYDIESSRVRLTQNGLDGAPMLVVLPTTTEVEWNRIRDMIVWPELVVQVYGDQLDVLGDILAQPFGYRDIYKTPGIKLYSSLSNQDDLPSESSLRYGHDYQLWAEEVPWSHGQLRTIQPGDRQPQPAPGTAAASQQSRTGAAAAAAAAAVVEEYNSNPIGFASNLAPPRPTHTGVFAASRKLDLNAMDPNDKGRFLREFSYANPLTVDFVKGIPVHVPPIDQLLDLKFDSLPRLAHGVLTPSETRFLQQKFFEMRSIMLERETKCQFPSCDFAFPYKQPDLIVRHIKDVHMAEKCNFCGDPLYQHWTVAQRFQHFASKHADILGALATSRPIDAAATHNDHPNPFQFQRELTWGFCCRCGRDHSVLASKLDRFHHDLVCYPGAAHHEVHPWRACTVCGERIHAEDAASAKAHKHPDVARGAGTGYRPAFCGQCGLGLRNLDAADREKHAHFCRGHCGGKGRNSASLDVRFCPWCGLEMEMTTAADRSQAVNLVEAQRHIDSCVAKPEDDKRTFEPLHSVSHMAYYYGIPKGAKTARVDVPEGVIPLKQWLGGPSAAGEKRKPLTARRGEMVGPKGATDLTPASIFGKAGGVNGVAGPGPATTAAAKTAAKKTARFADVAEEVELEEHEDEDEDMIGSDLSILSSEEERAARKAGKRPGGKRKRAPFTSDDPTYKPTWSWDFSDHSSEFMSDDEPEQRPSAAKKAKTVAEPAEEKKPKVSFRPTGKGGKKKLAPFQSEDPSYKPPKSYSDESELSDAAADPLDISLWPAPIEVVNFPGDDVIHESEEEEEEAAAEPTPMAKKAATKGATKGTAAAKAAEPPRPAKTQALTAAAAKAAAKAAAAAQDSVVERIVLKAPPKILPTMHGIREPDSDATTSSSEDGEESDEQPAKMGKGKGKAAAKKAAPKKAAGVTTRGKAKQVASDESEEEEDDDEDEDEEMGEAQSPVSAPIALDQDEEEGPPANALPALQAMKVKVLRAPDSPTTTRSRGLMAKMMQLPSGESSKYSNTSSSSSPHKTRSRGRGMGRPKVSLSPNPRLFGKGTSPDPLQSQSPTTSRGTHRSSLLASSQTDSYGSSTSQSQTQRLAHISYLKGRLHNLQTNPHPPPPKRVDFDSPSVTRAREQRMLRDAYTGADPSAPAHPRSPWAALQKQADAQEKEDDEYYALALDRYYRKLEEEMEELVMEIESEERALAGFERGKREREMKRKRALQEEEEDLEREFERVQRMQAEAARSYKEKRKGKATVAASKSESATKVAGFEEDYVDFSEDHYQVDDDDDFDEEEEEYDEEYDEEYMDEEYMKQAKWMKEQRRGAKKGKERQGGLPPPPGKVTDEDLEALARSYPGSIG